MFFSKSRKTTLTRTSSKEILEQPGEPDLNVGDLALGRVNAVWRRVLILSVDTGTRDAEKNKRVYQGVWETPGGVALRAWFCPALDGALKPADAFYEGLLCDPEVRVMA